MISLFIGGLTTLSYLLSIEPFLLFHFQLLVLVVVDVLLLGACTHKEPPYGYIFKSRNLSVQVNTDDLLTKENEIGFFKKIFFGLDCFTVYV